MAGQGPAADFVVAIARRRQLLVGEGEPLGGGFLLRQGQGPLALAPFKHGAGFHDQVVDRKVGGGFCQGGFEFLPPIGGALVGQVHDQIKAPAGQAPAGAGRPQPATGLP